MSTPDSHQVTLLLESINQGDDHAAEELLPLVYGELRKLARSRMARESPGQTLQPTALVHEAYMRLIGPQDLRWENRGHFFAAAAEAMRRILIDQARRKQRKKHGGEVRRTAISGKHISSDAGEPDPEELLALDAALDSLEAQDAQMAAVVKLRYFGGLTVDETAAALQTSPRSVNRLWTGARAWLSREMQGDEAG